MCTKPFSWTKIKGKLCLVAKSSGPLLAGLPLKMGWALKKQNSFLWLPEHILMIDSLLARKQATRHHQRKLLVKCEGKKVIKAITYSLELIVSVVNKSQRISLA